MTYTNLPLAQCPNSITNDEEETHKKIYQEVAELVSTFPRVEGGARQILYRHRDGWCEVFPAVVGAMVAQQHFKARPSDLILASYPKSGTTWLKALLVATVHRKSNANSTGTPHPLETLNPHQCVPFLESQVYTNNKIPNLDSLPSPRLFATHVPFGSLPESITRSNCKIIYICREPKDNLISWWYFNNKLRAQANLEPSPLEDTFELFCNGASLFGSLWDHVLGFWKDHLERPHQVLFLTYEGLSKDPRGNLKRLAEFVGCPFSVDEEKGGVLDETLKLCGFENLRSLGVNNSGRTEIAGLAIQNSVFFRRGGVKDWANHLTVEMARRIDEITESKFGDQIGLTF
ncbi:flavonol 4'-sulfotransferase-like [Typha angustifolia]|uniref:flavonol 4'-sulfotransferase-like n=1 Tax=Typha angustifolia TaxID=59011 RepID=UPI003C2DECF1